MQSIEDYALGILEMFPIHKEMPASISGEHHIGETHRQHLEYAVSVMKHLCDELNISVDDREMLVAATWLHDIGLYAITVKGEVTLQGWKYYESGYSRLSAGMESHGTIGASVLQDYDIPKKKEIQRLISVHMSHWYPRQPQPEQLYDYLICIADYVASRGAGIFEYKRR